MMLPSIFKDDLFDGLMTLPFEDYFLGERNPLYGSNSKNMMKTDIKENDSEYEVNVDLPGFKKDELKLELKNGYLVITASKELDKDEEDKKGRYIRRERYAGSMSRSFYVGNAVNQEDIRAKYENGILSLCIPKKDPKQVSNNNYIAIEG